MAKLSATLTLYDNFSKALNTVNSSMTRASDNMTRFKSKVSAPISNGPGDQMQKEASKANQAFNQMNSGAQKTGSLFKSVLGAGIITAGIQKGMGVISNSIDSAVKRFDTLQSYPKVMKQMGYSTNDTSKSLKVLKSGVDGLPTSLQDLTTSAQSFAILEKSATGGAKTATALNDAFLASGASAGDASRGVQQYSQMLATGTVDIASWRTLQETMPYALTKVAKSFGLTGKSAEKDLYAKLKSGGITMDQLNKKFVELDGGANGFAKTARTASNGIGTSFTNMKNAVTNGLADTLTSLDKGFKAAGTGGIAKMLDSGKGAIKSFFSFFNNAIATGIPKIVGIVKEFSPLINVIGSIIKAMAPVGATFVAASGSALAFSKAVGGINTAFNFLKANWVLVAIFALASAFVWAYQNIDWFKKGVDGLVRNLSSLAGKISSAIGPMDGFKFSMIALAGVISGLGLFALVGKLAGIAKGLFKTKSAAEQAGKGLSNAGGATNTLKNGMNSFMKSAGIALIIASLALLAAAIAPLAKTGTDGAIAMAAFGLVIGSLVGVFAMFGSNLQASIGGIVAFGAAVGLMAFAMAPLAQTGSQGAIAMAAFGLVIAGLVIVMAIFGPALNVAAVGMIAFGVAALLVGVAVMLIGVGIMLALVGFTMFAMVLPIVAAYGMQAALGMLLMGAALIVVGVGALVAGVGLLVLSVALIVLGVGAILAAVGMLLFGAALIMVAMGGMLAMIGLMMVSITIILIATFGMIAAIAMLLLGTALLLVGAGSMLAAVGVMMLGAGLMVMAIGMLIAAPAAMLLGAGLIIVGAGALVAGAGFIVLGAGLMVTAAAIMMVAAAIRMLFSVVSSVFSQIISAVTSAMSNVVSAVRNGMSQAVSAVKNVGSSLVSAGRDFVMGFVNGIKGAIGNAVSAAADMAKSAVNAAKSFLHIHSPSRVMRDQVGKFVGEGMAVGIKDSTSDVADASTSMAQSAVNAASGFNLPTIGGLGLVEDPGQALANGFMNALANLKALLSTMSSINGTQVNVRQGVEASANTVVPSVVRNGVNDNSRTQTVHIESGAINIVASDSDTPEDIVRKVEEFIAARQDANLKFG